MNGKQQAIDKITDFIEKIGYLDLVTEYIKRKGFQESITTYIEEKTPRLIEDKGKRYITNVIRGKKNEVELTEQMLDLHSTLINLPWNNIYTTNYDEMLELSNDRTNEEKLLLIQKEIEHKNKDLYIQLEKLFIDKEIEEAKAGRKAEILVKVLSMGGKKQTITSDNFRDLAKAFGVTLDEKYLG